MVRNENQRRREPRRRLEPVEQWIGACLGASLRMRRRALGPADVPRPPPREPLKNRWPGGNPFPLRTGSSPSRRAATRATPVILRPATPRPRCG